MIRCRVVSTWCNRPWVCAITRFAVSGGHFDFKKSPIFRDCTHKEHFLDDSFTESHSFVTVVVLDEENGHRLVLARAGQNSLHWPPGLDQVWSLTQFNYVDVSQSRIDVNEWAFNRRTIKVRSSFFWRCPGTSVPRATQLTMSLFLFSSWSNARGKSMVKEGQSVSSKSPSMIRDKRKFYCRNRREKYFPNEGSLIFYKKETEKNGDSVQTWW